MWGGHRRPHPVAAYKRVRAHRDDSVAFGPRKEKAAKRVRAVAIAGKLQVYVIANLRQSPETATSVAPKDYDVEIASMPTSVLKRLITSRGGFPDQVFRPTIRTTGGDEKLLGLLTRGMGVLAVREQEFRKWYRRERAKGRWPSQKSKRTRSGGRPSKQSEALKQEIARLVSAGSWRANDRIPKLCRLLVEAGCTDMPSVYTLRRLVRNMFVEMGDPALRRLRDERSAARGSKTGKIPVRSKASIQAAKSL
jgi:hypothetical protein